MMFVSVLELYFPCLFWHLLAFLFFFYIFIEGTLISGYVNIFNLTYSIALISIQLLFKTKSTLVREKKSQ